MVEGAAVIFPRLCKEIGHASTRPCGDKVYFLSRYLIREEEDGCEILEVIPDPVEKGMMRSIREERVLARPEEIFHYPDRVQIHDRARLVRLAQETGHRCTIFTGLDEHMTFVLDPDPIQFLTIHVYDVIPPLPTLSASVSALETTGLFGELDVVFDHHVRDLRGIQADVYPCRAAGFERTLDADRLTGGERVAGCRTASQLIRECYGEDFMREEICPLEQVREEPFIARCCRKEREGNGRWNGRSGVVVHWGAGPAEIYRAVCSLASQWRESA